MTIHDTQQEQETGQFDIVRELRLRRWARVHFVEKQARKPHWHSVVLDEMSRCDSESASQKQLTPVESTYVPIAPVPIAPSAPHFVSHEYRTTDAESYQKMSYELP